MKQRFSILALSVVLAFPGMAQVFEAGGFGGSVRMTGGGDLGSQNIQNPTDPASKVALDDKWLFGLRMTLNSWTYFGQEFSYAYHRTALRFGTQPAQQGSGMAIHTVTYGMLAYARPEGSRIRPFAQGGGGFSNFTPPGTSATRGGGSNKLGFFYGGGIKFTPFEDKPYLIRFDYRRHYTGKPFDLAGQDGLLGRTEISIGFSYVL